MTYKETVFGKIPEHWGISTINDITNIVTDYVANGSFATLSENVKYHEKEDYAVLIRLVDYKNDFKGNFVYIDKHAYEFLKKSELHGGEIIISNVGENVGTVFRCPYLNKPMSLGPNSVVVKFKECDDFYYYWLKSPSGQYMLHSIVTGSAQPKFNKTNFRSMLVPVPPIDEQEKIAYILNLIDNTIENNKNINQNLEQQTQAIFKSWFIDFEPFGGSAPQDWSYLTFGDVCHNIRTKTKDNDHIVFSAVNTGELQPSSEFFSKQVFSKDTSNYLIVPKKAFAYNPARINIGSIGLNMFDYEGCVSPVYVVFSVDDCYEGFFNYLIKTPSFREEVRERASGSVRQSLSYKDLSLIELIYPDKTTAQKFNDFFWFIQNKKAQISDENHILMQIRDTLLPKLMSGQIDVSSIKT